MQIKQERPLFLSRLIVGSIIVLVMLLFAGWISLKKLNPDEGKVIDQTVIDVPNAVSAFMSDSSSFEEVLDFFEDYTIYLSVRDEASYQMPDSLKNWVKERGGDELSQLGFRESYVGKVEQGIFVKEQRSDKLALTLEEGLIKVESAGKFAGDYSRLRIGKYWYEQANRGLNVFILNDKQQLLCTYNFDFFATDQPKSKALQSQVGSMELERIELVISEKNYNKLKAKRDEAIKANVLLASDEDLVKAKLIHHQQTHKADIRLKGDWVDHLQGDNWSFRVKLSEGETLYGMRKFSLHRPATRNYAGEWLFHQLLKKEDILHLRYDFVEVVLVIEGDLTSIKKNLGLYALEEFFEKQLIESNQRREGVIVKLDEGYFWEQRARFIRDKLPLNNIPRTGLDRREYYPILPFSQSRVREDSTLLKQFLTAKTLMQGYISDSFKISEVFDVDRMAKYNAICNLLGANHALIFHNQRFYYNPVNSRLEPIGFDGNAFLEDAYFSTYQNALRDSMYMRKYVEALDEVTQDAYIQSLLNWPGLKEVVRLMEQNFSEYKWSEGALQKNKYMIKANIDPVKTMNVYVEAVEDGLIRLSIDNFGKLPVEIKRLEHINNRVIGQVTERVLVNPNERGIVNIKMNKSYGRLFVNKKKGKPGFNINEDVEKIKLIYKVLGTQKEKEESLLSWKKNNTIIAETDLFRKKSTVNRFDFLLVDESRKTIICKPGNWKIDQWLIIPEGYTFHISAGTQIQFITIAAKIISFSPVQFLGTPEKPIEINSPFGLGQGFAVLNCQDTSVLRFCKFDNLTNPRTEGWSLTGAVNFYDAPVKIQNTEFTNNRCEDALNIFRSWFEIDQSYFSHTQSDAFDGDFVTGKISNTLFEYSGNDAIDISGSKLEVENVSITFAGDKGLSAGEDSQMSAQNISIEDSEVALASKDKSTLRISNARLKRNKLGMTAFQKKMEFGPAHIIADAIDLENNEEIHLIEDRSSCRLNGELTETVEQVKEQMYGVKYGKSSK